MGILGGITPLIDKAAKAGTIKSVKAKVKVKIKPKDDKSQQNQDGK